MALPHTEPYVHSADRHEDGKEYDALRVLALEMSRTERDKWPELLFLLGDQVYVDEGSPQTRERIRERRGTGTPPGDEVTDFEEYSWLYVESWSDPMIRWLFSTVSVSMLWDDHDMSDDWNISCSWVEEMRRTLLVARSRRLGNHELLDLPAPRQPLAARARSRTSSTGGSAAASGRPASCAASPPRSTRPAPAVAGATAATSATRGRSSWTRAPAGC